MAVTHGRFRINRDDFQPTSSEYKRFIVQRDMPELGYHAGQEISRRKAIEASAGVKRLEELQEGVPKSWRGKIIERVYLTEHGNRRGLARVLRELNEVRDITISRKGIVGDPAKATTEGWLAVLDEHGLLATMTPEDIEEFLGSPTEEWEKKRIV